MKTIQLSKGQVAFVDDEDYDYLNQWKWNTFTAFRKDKFYAKRSMKNHEGRWCIIPMHRLLMNTPYKMDIDHIDGNGLNNQKSNLRVCTRAQNVLNSPSRRNSSSRYKCVSWYKTTKAWTVVISKNGKSKHIGYFQTELEAAIISNLTMRRYHGEYARLNKLIKISY